MKLLDVQFDWKSAAHSPEGAKTYRDVDDNAGPS